MVILNNLRMKYLFKLFTQPNSQLSGFILLWLIPFMSYAQYGGGEAYPELTTNPESLKIFQNQRFGMFIHWGPVTLRGTEIGWSRGREVPIEDYDKLYLSFNPVLFNAAEWVQTAKKAGMKYLVITSKHHDGFCLWDSQYTDYDIMSTPYDKDILQELSQECKKQGIQFGVYYSIADWHHPDNPVEYPSKDYSFHKETGFPDKEARRSMKRYVTYMKSQLKEIILRYEPEIIWFDGEWEWAWTHEMGMDLYAYVRGLKDDILINNRVDKGREGMEGKTKGAQFAGDYATPEQQVGHFNNQDPWETCMTIATQWAWKPNDKVKSAKESIHTLLRTVGGDGNLLYNVGPRADGRIEKRQVDILLEMGQWLKINGTAVYGSRGGPWLPTNSLVSTRNGNRVYLHLLNSPGKSLELPLPREFNIENAYFLSSGNKVKVKHTDDMVSIRLPLELPDPIATILVLKLDRSISKLPVMDIP